jgi:oligopeptidase A
MNNPLLSESHLPLFSQIKPDHVVPAIKEAIAQYQAVVEKVAASPSLRWEDIILPLEAAEAVLHGAWSPVSHLNNVKSSPELRAAHDECLPLLSDLSTSTGQHEGLYQKYKAIAAHEDFFSLAIEKQTAINNALLDFTLSGIALSAQDKIAFSTLQSTLSDLSSVFGNNVLDATTGWSKLITDKTQLQGVPDTSLEMFAAMAEQKGLEGWLLTLDAPVYMPVMSYCDDPAIRKMMYLEFSGRASDMGSNAGKFDNAPVMNELLKLRQQSAELLGFSDYAALSLATKMATKKSEVTSFLKDLADKSHAQAQDEIAEVIAFANKDTLDAWDVGYYAEKLKEDKYSINDEMLRVYFPEAKVVAGLFSTVNQLFGLTVKEIVDVETWHNDVHYYEIYDDKQKIRGAFYLDLYAREGKRGGAWMDNCVDRRIDSEGNIVIPVAYLNCNFGQPVGDTPALFTHNEVTTLFHEFGHGLHHMLTKVETLSVSGINGVPWDAVELPSQFLENWCWEEESLGFISGHYESGESLPKALLDKMMQAKNYNSAMQMLRQLEFALFDFTIHSDFDKNNPTNIQAVLNTLRDEYAVIMPPKENRFQNGFSHIFSGGYAAGYYSYKWAEVLSADAFSKFEDQGIFDVKAGNDFLSCILEKGGSEAPAVLFDRFRGRAPSIDALLRHSGIS